MKLLFFLLLFLFQTQFVFARDSLNIAYFTSDIAALEPLSPSFDPDSYSVITQIFDSLVHYDLDGVPKPGLALSWKQEGELKWDFILREGVIFHNGEKFDGNSVKFTYEFVADKKNAAGNHWILNTIDRVEVDKKNPYKISIFTKMPDAMFLNRLNLFGSICPPKYIKKNGLKYFFNNPVGTGPFKFKELKKQSYILLEKNENYWRKGYPKLKQVKFVIAPEKNWKELFKKGEVDFIPNLSGRTAKNYIKDIKSSAMIKRKILSGYWVLLNNRGILADKKVRLAINYAVNKDHLVRLADYGNAAVIPSLGKEGEFGRNENLEVYKYSPKKAKQLLKEALGSKKLKLKILISDVSEKVGKILIQNLNAIGIKTEVEFVSRADWAKKIIGYKLQNQKRADYDMAINLVDNPIYHLGFHAGLFLFSKSPWSLFHDKDFDEKYLKAMSVTSKTKNLKEMKDLDKYIHDNAMMIFTTQKILTAVKRKNLSINKYGLNGHLNYLILSEAYFENK